MLGMFGFLKKQVEVDIDLRKKTVIGHSAYIDWAKSIFGDKLNYIVDYTEDEGMIKGERLKQYILDNKLTTN